MGELLGTGLAVAEKDRLYRCLDRIVEHKAALFDHLRDRWQDLFPARFEVSLYDLSSTYIEGEEEEIPKAKPGYSRNQRFDCRQVVIALVVTPEGLPLAYESWKAARRTAPRCVDFWRRAKRSTGERGECG